jgi:hypothetical protein
LSSAARSGPISTESPIIPSARPISFAGVSRSPSTRLPSRDAQSGMVNAMMAARPAGMSETP